MASEKAIYAPGELDKVKGRLGPVDDKEAKRMQKILGGEVGKERTGAEKSGKPARSGGAKDDGASGAPKARRTVEIGEAAGTEASQPQRKSDYKIRSMPQATYFERVKMDACCGEVSFGIKTPWQVFVSRLSFFKPPADLVNPHFIRQNLTEYYRQIELVVTTVRLLMPKGNTERSAKIKQISPFAYTILDTLRLWKINQISSEMGKLQMRPYSVYVKDLQSLLHDIYRPLYILADVGIETDIEEAFNTLYRVLFLENPTTETEDQRKKIAVAIASYQYIKTNIHYLLYPLMLKLLSDTFYPYELFFSLCEERILSFLDVSPKDKLRPPTSKKADMKDIWSGDDEQSEEGAQPPAGDQITDVPEGKTEQAAGEGANEAPAAEAKAVDKGLKILEMLFPKAGWEKINEYNDFFPYFSALFQFKKGSEIISPLDGAQLALVLSVVLEDILLGFRAIHFKEEIRADITPILDVWNNVLDEVFYNTYLKLINEYVDLLKSSSGAKSNYAMGVLNNIHWMRRYYFFPHYDYQSGVPPTFSRKDVRNLYSLVRNLRTCLTDIAAEIDALNRSGGAASQTPPRLIENLWEPFDFQVENAVSKRLARILPQNQRTNVSLLFFTLAIVTVLDNHLNSPQSVVYTNPNQEVFRSVNNAGREPILWVEKLSDVETIFRDSLAARKR